MGFRVQGSGFRVRGAGFRVQGAGFRVQGARAADLTPLGWQRAVHGTPVVRADAVRLEFRF